MGTAPVGAIVSITYDANDDTLVRDGDYLATNSGRFYKVLAARASPRRPGRFYLRMLVVSAIDLSDPPATLVHPLVWNSRDRRPR